MVDVEKKLILLPKDHVTFELMPQPILVISTKTKPYDGIKVDDKWDQTFLCNVWVQGSIGKKLVCWYLRNLAIRVQIVWSYYWLAGLRIKQLASLS